MGEPHSGQVPLVLPVRIDTSTRGIESDCEVVPGTCGLSTRKEVLKRLQQFSPEKGRFAYFPSQSYRCKSSRFQFRRQQSEPLSMAACPYIRPRKRKHNHCGLDRPTAPPSPRTAAGLAGRRGKRFGGGSWLLAGRWQRRYRHFAVANIGSKRLRKTKTNATTTMMKARLGLPHFGGVPYSRMRRLVSTFLLPQVFCEVSQHPTRWTQAYEQDTRQDQKNEHRPFHYFILPRLLARVLFTSALYRPSRSTPHKPPATTKPQSALLEELAAK